MGEATGMNDDAVRSRARSLPSTAAAIGARSLAAATRQTAHVAVGAAAAVRGSAVARLGTFLFGRREAVSIVTVLVSLVLAPAVAWWVATTTGYPPIEEWARGTWTGTDPRAVVFVGVALLVGLGAASAAANSGLVPTTLLVTAPLFGLAATRYGTRYVDPALGSRVVSLPEAIEFATAVAVLGGVPLGIAGFLVGALLRRAVRRTGVDAAIARYRGGA